MTNEDWSAVTDRSQKKRIQNRVAQRTYRNRIKERMEELQKEVNEYRRRAQEQQQNSGESQDGSVNGTAGETINVSVNNGKSAFSTEGTMDSGAEISSMPSVSSNTSPPSSINPANLSSNLSSNNSIKSKGSPEDLDKDKSVDRNSSSYTMELDTHDDATTLAAGGHSEPPTTNVSIQQTDAVVQPQRLTQPQHQRTQMPPQLSFTTFSGMASPPLPHTYNLGADWPWTNTSNSLYRDPIAQQTLTGFPSLRQVRGDHDSNSDASYTIPDVTAFMVQPTDPKNQHLQTTDHEMDVRATTADRSSDESSDPGSLSSSESSIVGSALHDCQDKNLAKMLESYGSSEQQLKDRCLEERFEFMRVCAYAAGFHSFDDMAKQYYTADFSHDSVISREQRNSRHSQLPQLFSKLRKSVKTWTQWEAHRYQYEVIKSAQSVIRAERGECSTAQPIYNEVLMELEKALVAGPAHNLGENDSLSKAFRRLSKVFQDTVSHQAFITTTTANDL
ncbi:bzip transcription factor domain-containing [Trichoderma arundinaceum]|uniref:Bzip transcription factor domain-containing n=1 Tax=Trichoderma arundinaceum TaxID=490622 RepID=A0A395NWN7_TRIAR|nr:bzip transcription factor domain-containing [Trichoderma arundinaceum]